MELGLSDNYEAISFNIGYTMQSGRDGPGPASNDNHPGKSLALQIQDWSKVINAPEFYHSCNISYAINLRIMES